MDVVILVKTHIQNEQKNAINQVPVLSMKCKSFSILAVLKINKDNVIHLKVAYIYKYKQINQGSAFFIVHVLTFITEF